MSIIGFCAGTAHWYNDIHKVIGNVPKACFMYVGPASGTFFTCKTCPLTGGDTPLCYLKGGKFTRERRWEGRRKLEGTSLVANYPVSNDVV
jgi:hypothetical protein